MNDYNKKLLIDQLDRKIEKISVLKDFEIPSKGWIHSIRTSMNMSLNQLAKRLKKTAPSIKEIEQREENKTITLKKLIEVAQALDLQFVYGFIPKESSIEKMIEKRAFEVAYEIVMRTSHSMMLEEQENSEERLKKSIQNRADEIKREVPRYLWD